MAPGLALEGGCRAGQRDKATTPLWTTDDPDALEISGGIDSADGDSYPWDYGSP